MQTANTINTTIFTDEETSLSVEINYSYVSRLLADTLVFDICAVINGTTITPDYVLREQVSDVIRENHNSLVEFEGKINLTFK